METQFELCTQIVTIKPARTTKSEFKPIGLCLRKTQNIGLHFAFGRAQLYGRAARRELHSTNYFNFMFNWELYMYRMFTRLVYDTSKRPKKHQQANESASEPINLRSACGIGIGLDDGKIVERGIWKEEIASVLDGAHKRHFRVEMWIRKMFTYNNVL